MNISLLIFHSSSSSVLFHSRKITFTVRNCFQFTAMIQIIQILLLQCFLCNNHNELSVWSWIHLENVGIRFCVLNHNFRSIVASFLSKVKEEGWLLFLHVKFSLVSGVHWQLSGARGQVPVSER